MNDYRFTSTLRTIPGGKAGSLATLGVVRALARRDAKTPELWRLSRLLTEDCISYDREAEAQAIQRYVRDAIRYVRDVEGVETVQSPRTTLRVGSGDCDDKTALAAALLYSVGFPVRYVLAATDRRQPGRWSHIYPETAIGGRWVTVETIVPGAPLGYTAPQYGEPHREA